MFFNCCLYSYILEVYTILLLFIQENGYGIIGALILFLMIVTAFLRLCITLGSNEFLGCYGNQQIYFLQYLSLGQEIVIWLWEVNSIDNSTLNRFFSLQLYFTFYNSWFSKHCIYYFCMITNQNNPLGIEADLEFNIFFSLLYFKRFIMEYYYF